MNKTIDKAVTKINNLDEHQKDLIVFGTSFVASLVARTVMYKKGMIKSFWYGLPKKPGTYR